VHAKLQASVASLMITTEGDCEFAGRQASHAEYGWAWAVWGGMGGMNVNCTPCNQKPAFCEMAGLFVYKFVCFCKPFLRLM